MNRQERAQQLNELVKSEQGLSQIAEIYRRECHPRDGDGSNPPPALMVDGILNCEFPPQSPGYLAPH